MQRNCECERVINKIEKLYFWSLYLDTWQSAFKAGAVTFTITQGITKGINVGLICVGESKSGKSTSLGVANSPAGPGLVALTATSIFDHVAKFSHFVGVSYLNIYNDKFADLLNPADKELKVIKFQGILNSFSNFPLKSNILSSCKF